MPGGHLTGDSRQRVRGPAPLASSGYSTVYDHSELVTAVPGGETAR